MVLISSQTDHVFSEFVFIRHGETIANSERRLQGGDFDSPLLETSYEVIGKIAKLLDKHVFDVVYVSPLPRAVETLEKLELIYKDRLQVCEELREQDYGYFSGIRKGIMPKELFEERDLIGRWEFRWEDGESMRDVWYRIMPFAMELLKLKNKKIGIVAHQTVNQVLLGYLCDMTVKEIYGIRQKNNEVFFLSKDELEKVSV